MDLRARLIGYPRIGPNRELKWTLERAWSGRIEAGELSARLAEPRAAHPEAQRAARGAAGAAEAGAPRARLAELRAAHLEEQRAAIGSAVDDFFLYDEVLETAMMLGI